MARILARPRLHRLLDRLRSRRILWLVGPPGVGKTSLVACWLRRRSLPHLWAQLDESDSDVAAFFQRLSVAARASARSGPPCFTPEALDAPGRFARWFFRCVAAAPSAPEVIVLDDYQEVRRDSPLHATLGEGLLEIPDGMAVVVTSRSDPPPALARLRASGGLTLIHGEELAVGAEEAMGIARLWGYSQRERDLVRALHERTGGWAAGLVILLAGRRTSVSARGASTPERALSSYLAEEVLAPSDPDTRKVLLETAFLPQVAETVAVRLTGVQRAGEILAALARRGYFVQRRAADEPTFQYHPLFREFLLEQVRAKLPDRLAALRLAAGRLLEEDGAEEEAIALYQQAGAWAEDCRAIEASAPRFLAAGRSETVAQWVLGVPEDVRAASPGLLLGLGLARSLTDPEEARDLLDRAFELFWTAGDAAGAYRAWAALVEVSCYGFEDTTPLDRWLARLEELQGRFPGPHGVEVEAWVATAAFAGFMMHQPWHRSLREWEDRAMAVALTATDVRLRLQAGRPLALYYAWWGIDLVKGRVLVETLRGLVSGENVDPGAAISWLIADASLHRYLGDPDTCLALVDRGLAISAESGLHAWDAMLLSLRCRATMMNGDLTAAAAALEHLRVHADGARPLDRCMYHDVASALARLKGDLEEARQHGQVAVQLAVATAVPLAESACRLACALAQPSERIEDETRRCLAFASRCGSRLVVAESRLALAAAAMDRGDEEGAAGHLREGFRVAREIGVLHSLALDPRALSDCCALALEARIEARYVAQLIRAQGLAPGARAAALEGWPWALRIEALGGFTVLVSGAPTGSDRKAQTKPLEVLKLLVAHGPAGMRQDALAAAVWPDADGTAAYRALKTTVFRARQILGNPRAILQGQGRVALDPRLIFVDAWALDRLLQRAEALRSAGDDGSLRLEHLRSRIQDLYVGELFGPDADDPRLAPARERLHRRVERSLPPPGPARSGIAHGCLALVAGPGSTWP